jgi:ribosomal-protein-alanine N-acetyltransferase
MSWTIRRMAGGDIAAVLALAEKIPEAPHWNRIDYERCVAEDSSSPLLRAGFVAETPAGFLGFSIGKIVAGICELESIAVALEARGQGIGQALLAAVSGWARAQNAVRLELEVRASNSRAVKVYEDFGMRREGRRPGYYQSPEEDALLMGITLTTGGKLA